jgi:D-3-phosphoglycerate dehydrogenase
MMLKSPKRAIRILVTEPEYFTVESISMMRSVGSVIAKRVSRQELLAIVPNIDVLVVRVDTKLDREILKRAVRLRCVVSATTGLNHIDTSFLKARAIPIFSLHGTHSVSTAEHALALLFAMARNVSSAHNHLLQGKWERWKHIGIEMTGKTLGIFGIGRIGTEVARRARAMKMDVIAYDPYVSAGQIKKRGARKVDFKTLLAQSDFLTIHAPLTVETRDRFGEREFRSMKRSAILINAARGEIVKEKELIAALARNVIRGAAVDVYPDEPLVSNSGLVRYARTHSNIILTPHIAASTLDAIKQASICSAKAIVNFFT